MADVVEHPLLTDCEDRLLAMAEDEFVTAKLAQQVLGAWYGRQIALAEIRTLAGHLSTLGLLRWHIRRKGRLYARRHVAAANRTAPGVMFTTTALGKALLAASPRRVLGRPDGPNHTASPARNARFRRLLDG